MTARTTGQAAFEAFQTRRYRHSAFRTEWGHPSVDESRPAWEDAGEEAVREGAGPALAAALNAARQARELLETVRTILADHHLEPAEARRYALAAIDHADSKGDQK